MLVSDNILNAARDMLSRRAVAELPVLADMLEESGVADCMCRDYVRFFRDRPSIDILGVFVRNAEHDRYVSRVKSSWHPDVESCHDWLSYTADRTGARFLEGHLLRAAY